MQLLEEFKTHVKCDHECCNKASVLNRIFLFRSYSANNVYYYCTVAEMVEGFQRTIAIYFV